MNIFYLWSLLSGADLLNKWIQIIGFSSPIISGVLFAFGPLLIASYFAGIGAGLNQMLPFLIFGTVLFLPQLVQLVPSIAYALYIKEVAISV